MANDLLVDIAVTRVYAVTTVTAPAAPTVAELNAGMDITDLLTTGSEIDYADSDVISEMSWAQGQKVEAPSLGNYTVQLNMFRKFTSGVAGTADPSTIFTNAFPTVYIYKRVGLASSAAWAAAQVGDVFKIIGDKPKKPAGVGGYLKLNVKGLVTGYAVPFVVAA